tara:strand:+ start:1983 stop:2366 length:384 start_codon:yes stop_codon:yes gene_type:complete
MGGITSAISDKLIGQAPIERIAAVYEDPKKFYDEMNNYLIGGLVISCSKFFMMVKPIESNKDPSGQWWPKNPDCWYARWVAGDGGLMAMFNSLEPLPRVMFRRIKPGGESELKTLSWERMYKKVCHE